MVRHVTTPAPWTPARPLPRGAPRPPEAVPAGKKLPGREMPPCRTVRRAEAPRRPAAPLAGLDPAQRRAVTHGDGPLLVIAGAGTGKTRVITRRIAWLIATRRARPSQILALTFTDRAAEEMQTRVDELVPYGYADTTISTFHAFGDRLIREFALDLRLPTDVRVLSRAETIVFLREHLFALGLDRYRPLGDPTRFLGALATLFSRCKDEGVAPAGYLAHAGRLRAAAAAGEIEVELAERQAELAGAYAAYQELLGRNGLLDFGDQVALALRLLREDPEARASVQRRYRYILVDEFQDTNPVQADLVALLAEPHRNVTVVGDDDQSIYAFRGAALDNILGFGERYRGARRVVLRRNHRSHAPILEAAYRLIRHNDPDRLEVRARIDKRLLAQRRWADPLPVRHEAFATGSDEADWVARQVGERVAAGRRPREIAVLVRSNAAADPFLRSLSVAGIPWRFSGAAGLFARPAVRLLLAFLRALADPASSVDLYALAASERYRLDGADLMELTAYARRRSRTLWEVCEEVVRQPGVLRLAPATRVVLGRLVADLREYRELARQRPAGEVLYAFLRRSGWLAELAGAATAEAEEALPDVARFFETVRRVSAWLPDDRVPFLARHLQALVEAGDDAAAGPPDPDLDAVQVLTVHQAKGLEFGVVFLVGMAEGAFPSGARREPLALPEALGRPPLVAREPAALHLAEERRLCYVAMTRARDELVLTSAAERGGRRARRISPFVLEALDAPGGRAAAGASPSALERLASFEAATAAPPARIPRRGPLELSFYQVDDYLTCPLKYRYVHLLRVPVQQHHSVVYGAALHRAVQEFHRRHGKGEVMREEALIAAFEAAWTGEGFLTREHEEARLAAGRDALRRFRAAQLRPGVRPPALVEQEFAFVLDGDRIRGRWDRVDVGPATEPGGVPPVTITDYKSSDVRDLARARARARDSLQLGIYALAWTAAKGRPPDAVQLHFLESGVVGRVPVDEGRLAKARERIGRAAAGLRGGDFTATPGPLACGYCAFRDICPVSAAR